MRLPNTTEQLNEEAMFARLTDAKGFRYAIYEREGEQLSLFEEDEEEPMDLNEAEEFLRHLRQENPQEFERIANLRDGIRTGQQSPTKGIVAFLRAGRYQQLVLLDTEGNVVSRELSEALRAIQCSPEEPAKELPFGYNSALMRAKIRFDDEVKHRIGQRDYTASLTRGQRYVLRELRTLFDVTRDDDVRASIMLLEGVIRLALPVAVTKELDLLRRNGVTGSSLLEELKLLYFQYNLKEFNARSQQVENETSKIVCSSALV